MTKRHLVLALIAAGLLIAAALAYLSADLMAAVKGAHAG